MLNTTVTYFRMTLNKLYKVLKPLSMKKNQKNPEKRFYEKESDMLEIYFKKTNQKTMRKIFIKKKQNILKKRLKKNQNIQKKTFMKKSFYENFEEFF